MTATTPPVARIALAIRYEPHFGVRDRIGSIVDEILRGDGTPFGPDVFPLSNSGDHAHLLSGKDPGEQLLISERDAILQLALVDGTTDEIQELAESFADFVIKPLLRLGKIRKLNRYGCLFNIGECTPLFQTAPIATFLSLQPHPARDMALRFSYRLMTEDGWIKSGVNDYRNAIYQLSQSDENVVQLAIDYQEYFDPPLEAEQQKKKPFVEFVKSGLAYLAKDGSSWIRAVGSKEAKAA